MKNCNANNDNNNNNISKNIQLQYKSSLTLIPAQETIDRLRFLSRSECKHALVG